MGRIVDFHRHRKEFGQGFRLVQISDEKKGDEKQEKG